MPVSRVNSSPVPQRLGSKLTPTFVRGNGNLANGHLSRRPQFSVSIPEHRGTLGLTLRLPLNLPGCSIQHQTLMVWLTQDETQK